MKIMELASCAILDGTATLYPSPRPYPELKEAGAYWVYFPPYWIAFRHRAEQPIISAVLYDNSDMPNRV